MTNKYNISKPISVRKFDRVFEENLHSAGVVIIYKHDSMSMKPKNSVQAVKVGDYVYTKFLSEKEKTYCLRYNEKDKVYGMIFNPYPTDVLKPVMF